MHAERLAIHGPTRTQSSDRYPSGRGSGRDATIACTYMMLAAHARNLHSCWTGAFEESEVREVLGLPQHIRPVALLAIGKGRPPLEPMERMPVGEHVHREAW